MEQTEEFLSNIAVIEKKLGYVFKNRELLRLAFTHRSFVNETKEQGAQHNERLEFLGDSVLGLLVSDYLYRYLPETPEGELSYLRSRLVEACSCALYLAKLGVTEYILLGKGELMSGGRGKDSIHADLFEALMGAIYLDGGIEAAGKFLFINFSPEVNRILKTPIRNWKAELQDYSQKHFQHPPEYTILDESGPDHHKKFFISVAVNGTEVGRGEGSSKKEAQQSAAAVAVARLIPESMR
jgi:ribonuclease-3